MTKSKQVLLCAILIFFGNLSATPVLFEDFSNGVPKDWTYVNVLGGSQEVWDVSEGVLYAWSASKFYLSTPVLNLSGYSTASISINAKSCWYCDGTIGLYYQNKKGGQWTPLTPFNTAETYSTFSITLPNLTSEYRVAIDASAVNIESVSITSGSGPFVTGVSFGISGEVVRSISHPVGTTKGLIDVGVPYGQSLVSLTPKFVGAFTSYTPAGAANFSNIVAYSFAGAGGPSTYNISVTNLPKSTETTLIDLHMATYGINDITEGFVTPPTTAGQHGRIDVQMSPSTLLEGLKLVGTKLPRGATYTVQPQQSTFDCPDAKVPCFVFTVVAEDGVHTQPYDVYIRNRASGSTAVLESIRICYDVSGSSVCKNGIITQPNAANTHGTVLFVLPDNVDLSDLALSDIVMSDWATTTTAGNLDLTNSIPMIIKAEDGKTSTTYDISAGAEKKSSFALLYSVYFQDENGKYAFGFLNGGGYGLSSDVIHPTSELDTGIVELAVPFEFEEKKIVNMYASGSVKASISASVTPSSETPFDLTGGKVLYITATAEDGKTKRVYRVKPIYSAKPSSDAGIVQITLSDGNSNFFLDRNAGERSSGTYKDATTSTLGQFQFEVAQGVKLANLKFSGLQVSDPGSSVEYVPESSLWDFENSTQVKKIKVTAPDKTVREYSVSAVQKPSTLALIESIKICDLDDVCASAEFSDYLEDIVPPSNEKDTGAINIVMGYSANLDYLHLKQVTVSPYSSLSLNAESQYFGYALTQKGLVITVFAEDGVTKRNYMVKPIPEQKYPTYSSSLKTSSSTTSSSTQSSSSSIRRSSSSSKGTTKLQEQESLVNAKIRVNSDWLDISFDHAASYTVQILSLFGSRIQSSNVEGMASKVSIQNLHKGRYILNIVDSSGHTSTTLFDKY